MATAMAAAAPAAGRVATTAHKRVRARTSAHAGRREALLAGVAAAASGAAGAVATPAPARADTECTTCSNSNTSLQPGDKEFATTPSGLRVLDIRAGAGATPADGSKCVVSWTGYTAGYQGKRIESSADYDEPFVFTLGAGEAIPAFEEAVRGMAAGGLRRLEIPGELVEELAYPIAPKATRYNAGPVPKTFSGQRALDFVLDNATLKPFNRTLLFDVRLDAVR